MSRKELQQLLYTFPFRQYSHVDKIQTFSYILFYGYKGRIGMVNNGNLIGVRISILYQLIFCFLRNCKNMLHVFIGKVLPIHQPFLWFWLIHITRFIPTTVWRMIINFVVSHFSHQRFQSFIIWCNPQYNFTRPLNLNRQ